MFVYRGLIFEPHESGVSFPFPSLNCDSLPRIYCLIFITLLNLSISSRSLQQKLVCMDRKQERDENEPMMLKLFKPAEIMRPPLR